MSLEFGGDFLQWLKGFYYIVQTGSFSRAGEMMNRKQSSITYQIKKLEENLGVSLIHRKSTPIRLTEEGMKLYPIARRIFDHLDQIQSEISQKEEYSGRISITASYGIAAHFLPYHISQYRSKYPQVEIDVLPERTAFIQQAYTSEASNFVITQEDLLPPEAVFVPVYSTELFLVLPSTWEEEPKVPVSMEYIASQPIVGLVRELPLDQCVCTAFEEKNLKMNVVQYTGFFLTALQYISLGVGISVLDKLQAETPGFPVKTYSLSHLFPVRVYGIAYRPHQYLAPHVRHFINYLQEQKTFCLMEQKDL